MKKIGKFRIILFSAAVAAILFSGIYVTDYQAKPLLDAHITLTKTGAPIIYSKAGEEISYSYVLNNTSADDLYTIKITDDLVSVSCPDTSLERGKEMTCTSKYTITEEDVANAQVTNHATVTSEYHRFENSDDCGDDEEVVTYDVSAKASFTVTLLIQPALSLKKTGTPNWFMEAGEEIKYKYLIENTGNTPIDGPITVADDMVTVNCPSGELAVGESMECTATYTSTLDDVAAEVIRNTAVASAGDISSEPDSFEVILEVSPELSLTKSANPTNYNKSGQLIIYTFNMTNTGNVTLAGPFEIEDPMLDQFRCAAINTLLPGASQECYGYYRIREWDTNQTITNCATASGIYQGQPINSNEACADVYYEPPKKRPAPAPPPPDEPDEPEEPS